MLLHYIPELITISGLTEIVAHTQSMQVFMHLNVLNSIIHPSLNCFRQTNQGCNATWSSLTGPEFSQSRERLIDDKSINIHKEVMQPEATKVNECVPFVLPGRAAGSVDSLPFQIVVIIPKDDIRILIFTVADSMMLIHFIPGLASIPDLTEIVSLSAFMKVDFNLIAQKENELPEFGYITEILLKMFRTSTMQRSVIKDATKYNEL
jgi:hypothetical protein